MEVILKDQYTQIKCLDVHTLICVEKLRQKLKEHEDLKYLEPENNYLLKYLNSTNFDVEESFKKINDFYKLLLNDPRWFTTKSPLDLKHVVEEDMRVVPGTYDKKGRLIYIVKVTKMDPYKMDLVDDILPLDDCLAEAYLLDQFSAASTKGVCVVIDIANFHLKFMKYITPHNIKMIVNRLLSMPIKEYRFHVVNYSFLIQTSIKIIWRFLPQSIRDVVRFHYNDRESFYKYVDREELPVEYGGYKKEANNTCHKTLYDHSEEITENFKKYRTNYLLKINQK